MGRRREDGVPHLAFLSYVSRPLKSNLSMSIMILSFGSLGCDLLTDFSNKIIKNKSMTINTIKVFQKFRVLFACTFHFLHLILFLSVILVKLW